MEEFNIQGKQTSFYTYCPGTFGYTLVHSEGTERGSLNKTVPSFRDGTYLPCPKIKKNKGRSSSVILYSMFLGLDKPFYLLPPSHDSQ